MTDKTQLPDWLRDVLPKDARFGMPEVSDRDMACMVLPDLDYEAQLAAISDVLRHHGEVDSRMTAQILITKAVRETEAEAVAFVVCHALGLETGTGSADYIQLYHGDANLLKESLEVVQRTASVILGALSPEGAQNVKAVQ
jgi:hypothetical protein